MKLETRYAYANCTDRTETDAKSIG